MLENRAETQVDAPQELVCEVIKETVLETGIIYFYIPFSVAVFQNLEDAKSFLKKRLKKPFLHLVFYYKISFLKYLKQTNH